jgi:hypothetical protein
LIEAIGIGFKFSSPITPPFFPTIPRKMQSPLSLSLSISPSLLAGWSPVFSDHFPDHFILIPPFLINSPSHLHKNFNSSPFW